MSNSGVLKTFDPKKVIVTWGAIIFTDFADGAFVEITQEDNFEAVMGADGSENRVNKNRTGGDCNVTLQQQSITNDALSAQYEIDKANNTGYKPFTVKDINGTTLAYSPQAYIKKLPDMTESSDGETRQWNFRLPQLQMVVGGNL